MARRNDHSRDEIHEMALQAAERLLDREGLSGLSTRKIALEIGYSVGSLYLVFENLDDLIVQMNARTLGSLGDCLDRSVVQVCDPRQGLIELGRAYLQFAAQSQSRWELIFGHKLSSESILPEDYRTQVQALFWRVERWLEILAPHRSANERVLAARALWSGVHGVCTLALGGKLDVAGIADAKKLTDSLIVNYLAGWCAAQPTVN